MDITSTKRELRIRQWHSIIQDRINSGLNVKEYCNQNGLSRNSYFYWLRIIREDALQKQHSSSFVEMQLPAATQTVISNPAEIPLIQPASPQLTLSINGVTIQVTENTSSALLARTIEVIRNA